MFRITVAILAATFVFSCVGSLDAQIETGTLVGTVRDTTGAVIAGVEIAARHVATGRTFTETTNATGDYLISRLPTGQYQVSATKEGFKTEIKTSVALEVSRTLRVDLALTVGSVSDKVEVKAEAPLLNSESAEVGHVVTNQVLESLPTEGRDFLALVTLSPGVLPIRGTPNAGGTDSGFSARGQRRGDNVLYFDGGVYSSEDGFTTFTPSLDALQEFQVKTGLYGAEYGIRPGAQVITVTKSGTNQFHGSAFEFLQNDDLNARNFFQTTKPEFKRNQFGGTLGGPIWIPKLFNGKDKAWFFVSFQKVSSRDYETSRVTVPTPAQKSGVFPNTIIDPLTGQPFANNTIPSDRINPVSAKLLQFWPDPNITGALNFASNSAAAFDNPQVIARVDFTTSDKKSVVGALFWDDSPLLGTSPFPIFSSTTALSTTGVDIGNTRNFGPRVVNVALAHFFRRPAILGQMNPQLIPVAPTLGINNFTEVPINAVGVPAIDVTGLQGFGGGAAGVVLVGNWEFKDDFAFQKGNHFLKSGVEYKRDYSFFVLGIRGGFSFTGRYSGDPFADFLLGYADNTSQGGDLQRGNDVQNNWFFYFQDDWKVSPKLTLNLGLRYEYAGAWKDKRGFSTNFHPETGTFVPPLASETLGPFEEGHFVANVPILTWNKNGIFPRLGFAYRLGSQTVVKGGFAIYGNQPDLNTGIGALQQNPRPGTFGKVFIGDPTFPNLIISDPFPTGGTTAPTGVPDATGAQDPMPWTRSYNWGVSVEHQLASNFLIGAGYQGTRNTNLIESVSINDAPPGPGAVQPRRAFPNLGEIDFGLADGKAWYDALETKIEKRAGRDGLFFLDSFTWSKSLDNVQSRLSGNIIATRGTYVRSVNMPLAQNKGRSESDIPRRFVFSAGYELPWGPGRPFLNQGPAGKIIGGWSIQSLFVVQDGYWFTVALPGDPLNTGSSWSQRPDLIGDPNLPTSQRTPAQWFNTAAFAAPVGFRYGNAGRGIVEGPGIINLDFAIHRTFSISERHKLEFRGEMFNVANHTNFGAPGNQFGTSSFGVIGSALPARLVQLALRYSF